jgi:hypothetical protein
MHLMQAVRQLGLSRLAVQYSSSSVSFVVHFIAVRYVHHQVVAAAAPLMTV